jgi:hypothetical protein
MFWRTGGGMCNAIQVMMLKYQLEIKSDLDLDTVRERIVTILKKREYGDVKVFYNIVSFDNGYVFRRSFYNSPVKVQNGTFYLKVENDLVIVQLIYKIAYIDLILILFGTITFGIFIDFKFFFLSALAIVGWIFQYIISKLEAEELIAFCQKKV